MNFVDTAVISVAAGAGGNGAISFRREKFVDHGGPNGGDGGDGGNVIFEASLSENTLADFRNHPKLVAPDGGAGSNSNKHGRNGEDLIIRVPVGTVITEVRADAKGPSSTQNNLADLTEAGQSAVIAKGGRGGFGNAHFISSTRQAPKFAEKGEPGEARQLTLELKMIADVGLVGLPNAGKSTLLSRLSNARPEVADYPFTTLIPNLGVVDVGKISLLFADIPGLIEGAASGKGLGHEFLRHVERTAVIIHLIDAYQPDLAAAYQTIQHELKDYRVDLTNRPQIIALNKTEGLDATEIGKLEKLVRKSSPKGTRIIAISAQSGQNLSELVRLVAAEVAAYREREANAVELSGTGLPVIKLDDSVPDNSFEVAKTEAGFVVTGKKIEKFAARTDFGNRESVARLKDIMRKTGIMHELARCGYEPGQKISIAGIGSLKN